MQNVNELNAKILDLTLLIQNKYPELSKFLTEMPVTIPIEAHPTVNLENLQNYYDSLDQVLKNYILEMPNKK